MSKDLDEELFEKYSNLVIYANKIKTLKSITKGHKQRFINMILELLKFRGKNLDAQIWIYYTLSYFQKHINKFIKAVESPVALKLEQQIKEIMIVSPYNIDYTPINNEIINMNIKENKSKKEKEKNKEKENIAIDNTSESNSNNINVNKEETENKMKRKISQLLEKINAYKTVKEFIIKSINKENRSNKIFCEVFQFLNNFNLSILTSTIEINNIKINIRQKLLNLICLVFPFISNKQKTQIMQKMQTQFESDAINILEKSKFIDKSLKNNAFEFLISSLINKKICQENLNNFFQTKLFINRPNDIFDLYKIYAIISIFKFKNYEDFIYQISFKLKFFLENYHKLYKDKIELTYGDVYNILFRLKKFYINGYNNKFCTNEDDDMDIEDTDLDLFTNEENNIYKEFFNHLNKFYYLRKNIDLVSGYTKELKNFEFPFNLVELIQMKNNLIKNNFDKYKMNLINIEKKIFQIGHESLFANDYTDINILCKNYLFQFPLNETVVSNYKINETMKNAFISLNYFLHKKLFNYNFTLYPYGSATEFLSDKESDIDLFLDISQMESKEQKLTFLYNLIRYIKYFDKLVNSTISTRVCVISFVYKNINFDMSIVGFCPYLHSVLIREYSLIDPRFPLLLIAIKHMIKSLKINNISEDKNHSFLNSFSWSLLLISFLQDIVQPPVLPKILSNSEVFILQGFFGNNKIEKEEEEKSQEKNNENIKLEKAKLKNFESFVSNMELKDVEIPTNLGDINNRKQLYQQQIKIKNNMTCSELLLKFLEFIIFHFKYDTIFVNCSFSHEGFQNIDTINYFKSDEDVKFLNYFKTKYIRKLKGEGLRDGYFLIRDPFDPRYNPAQTLKASSLKKFFSRLKLAYYHLLNYGNFYMLKKQIEFEEDLKKGNKF